MPISFGASGVAANAANSVPSAEASVRSSWSTAAPRTMGTGGSESRSKHTTRALPRRPPLLVPRQAVVRERFPRRRVRDELAVLRANPGIVVEGAEPHRDHVRIVGAAAPQRGAARRAELLRESTLRNVRAHELLTGEDAERTGSDASRRRGGGAGAALAARAVAVARGDERLADLEPHAAAEAAAGERQVWHGTHPTQSSGAGVAKATGSRRTRSRASIRRSGRGSRGRRCRPTGSRSRAVRTAALRTRAAIRPRARAPAAGRASAGGAGRRRRRSTPGRSATARRRSIRAGTDSRSSRAAPRGRPSTRRSR